MSIDTPHRRLFEDKPAAAVLLILLVTCAVYANSFRGAFVFDDTPNILENPRIRQLWPVRYALFHSSRPVTQFSFALNHAWGGFHTAGYHAVNLAIHLAAALTLFGIARRTYRIVAQGHLDDPPAIWTAAAIALLWAAHPLQTESVTYIVQRAESLMGLFYLLTLYCVIRGAESRRESTWMLRAIVCCALGMGSKPAMATAPVVVLLYDRVFLVKSFAELWRRRWDLYVGLAATWGVLAAVLVTASFDWSATAGNIAAVSPVGYALSQPGVILRYLLLSLWPGPLCFDYGWPVAHRALDILPGLFVLLALMTGTAWAWMRRPWLGFLGAWLLLTLAPSSSVIPIADLAAEHRMYLPLAAVVAAAVFGAVRLWELPPVRRIQWLLPEFVLAVAVLALGCRTILRNNVYRSELTVWQDTVAKRPGNVRAHSNLASELVSAGRYDAAIAQCQEALRLRPDSPQARNNWGNALAHLGRFDDAITQYAEALRLKPDYAEAHNGLGAMFFMQKRLDLAVLHYQEALRINPQFASARMNLQRALKQPAEAR